MIGLTIRIPNQTRKMADLFRAKDKIDANVRKMWTTIGLHVQTISRRYAPFLRGGIERSILFRVGTDYVEIYVPSNSEAGAYAKIRHDVTNTQRGPRTVAKGAQAGPLYIKRAIRDEKDAIIRIAKSMAFKGV